MFGFFNFISYIRIQMILPQDIFTVCFALLTLLNGQHYDYQRNWMLVKL